MKTFEEKFTQWIDGSLTARELTAFEAELAKLENPEAEKEEARRLGALLRDHYQAPGLGNADFFNHQLMRRIAADPAPAVRAAFFWTLPRLAWAGAACLGMVAAIYFTVVPKGPFEYSSGREYVAQILDAQTSDPAITATTIHSKDNKLTVLWLDGLDYLPSETDQR